jgi:hypothetical protein
MDGTMIDSMPWHLKRLGRISPAPWAEHRPADLMRRTTGRNGPECMRELFQPRWMPETKPGR